ncbi:MAG: hypothetical protein NXI00_07675 [Cytophagales bacterium]|nr:hypothetical protein [Cytophagales bacterium]
MGLSYNIIPTSEMIEKEAYLEHFKSIDTYEFPDNYNIETKSRFPKLEELEEAINKSGCTILNRTEEPKNDTIIKRSYQLKHPNHKYESDFTIDFKNHEINSMMGIHGDFNIMLRIATELSKICGTMIIWSAYDAHYIEKDKTYEQIWNKIKINWANEE